MIRSGLSLSLAMALVLAGCATPGAQPPQAQLFPAETLAAGHDISAARTAPSTWPVAAWWQQLGDAQLDALIARALDGNPKLAIAADRISQARALSGGARAATLPMLRAETSSIHMHFSENELFPPPLGGGDFWDNTAQLAFSYDLDLWGRDEKALEAALAAVQVASYEAQSARLALTGAIVRNYAALALQFELRDNSSAILDDQQRAFAIAQRRFDVGIGTELETQEIRTEMAATRATLEQIDTHIAVLRHTLGALTGAGPGAGDTLQRPALRFDQLVALPSVIPAELVGRRPDVVAELWRVQRAADTVDVAKASFYPNINLRAFAGVVSFGFSKWFDQASENYGGGPAITLPIFDGDRLRSGLQARNAEFDAAVHSYNATVVDALTDVANQIATLNALQRVREQRADALSAASRAHELALQAFRAGLTDSLNVLHTQTALSAQRNQLADVHFQQLVSWSALNQALGGGMIDDPAAAMIAPNTVSTHAE